MIQPVSTLRIILTLLLAAASSSLGAQSREVVVGTMVEIHLRSEDTDHGFRLADGTNVIIPKRRHGEAVVEFEAESPGTYWFECSKLCGAGHHFMRGEIVVTPRPTDASLVR